MSPADSELFNSAIISLHSAPDLSLAKDGTEIIDEALSGSFVTHLTNRNVCTIKQQSQPQLPIRFENRETFQLWHWWAVRN